MPTKTKIEWADYVSNPVKMMYNRKRGWACVKLSEGCKHCWASGFNVRLGTGLEYTRPNIEKVFPFLDENEFMRLINFKPRGPFKNGRDRALVFMCDMTDWLGEWVSDYMISRIITACQMRPDIDFALLTKRPERLVKWCQDHPDIHFVNIWIGISIENQRTADERMPHLQNIPAEVRFISAEPLLESVDLVKSIKPDDESWEDVNFEDMDYSEPEEFVPECDAELDWVNYGSDLVLNPEYVEWENNRLMRAKYKTFQNYVDWVIVGGESGPGARPMLDAWANNILEDCVRVGVPFFFKQHGEWLSLRDCHGVSGELTSIDGWVMVKVGKKRAGHLLSGMKQMEMPC